MPTKTCFKCFKNKPLHQFYKHKRMADGHLNKCKSCTKKDVKRRYYDPRFISKIREYERMRNKLEHRRLKKQGYRQSSRKNHPGKNRCHMWIHNALRDKRIIRMPCEVCGNPKSEAHHSDYRRPSKVNWLCFRHHRELHGNTLIMP